MAEERRTEEWDRCAMLAAIVVNAHGGLGKGKTAAPEDFNPYRRKAKEEVHRVSTAEGMAMLKKLFVDNQ